ncbi:MAG TPA: glyoxalase [Bacteroidetes bacterium]|nr:glyoxalase [Bacteroidota bacterium]
MKLNAGIITSKLAATKSFYVDQLGFGVAFENEWYLLLHTPDGSSQISFLLPNLESQKSIFQPEFNGRGVYLTIEVEDVDEVYQTIKNKGIPIEIAIRDEPWGDRHFAVVDPNGIGIDFVHYQQPENDGQ